MISIIVSSYNNNYFEQLSTNVHETIGNIEYEVIRIYNPGTKSICEAYNEGGDLAKYEYLIFCHEDMIFKTRGWGEIVLKYFINDNKLGALGVAGSSYVPYIFTGWGGYMLGNEAFHVIQHHKYNTNPPIYLKDGINGNMYMDVVAIDGLFIATKKVIWSRFKFDNNTFTKFHFYDVDFSLRISRYFKVKVVYDILIEHFSEGNYDKDWLNEFNFFNEKWSDKLPVSLNNKIERNIDTYAEYRYLKLILKNKTSLVEYFERVISKKYISIVGVTSLLITLLKFPIRFYRLKFNSKKYF